MTKPEQATDAEPLLEFRNGKVRSTKASRVVSRLTANTLHADLFSFLVDHPNSYFGDIQKNTQIAKHTLNRILNEFVECDVIIADSERVGYYPAKYRVDVDYLKACFEHALKELIN